MDKWAVIDFETTGLSPDLGDRATEVAVVIVEDNQITDRFQSLMNSGVRVPGFIQQLTGISNAMLSKAPPSHQVMNELVDFIGDTPLIAHNASFDTKFLDAEWARVRHTRRQAFACTLLLSRRIYPDFSQHNLGYLVQRLQLPTTGQYHRALADAEMTAHLMVNLITELQDTYQLSTVPHDLLCLLQKAPKAKFSEAVRKAKKREKSVDCI